MDMKLINILVEYFIAINLISLVLVYLKGKTNIINIKNQIFNIICIILSIIGGPLGVLLGVEMANYERDNKVFRKWIPFIIFIEIAVIIVIIYNKIK